MFAALNSEVENFYSPINVSGYLTPLQRKKLREKRKIDISADFDQEFITPKKPKKLKPRNVYPDSKVQCKKRLPKKKQVKSNLARCITSDLLVKGNTDDNVKDNKFFKSRSPQHLKKVKFSVPMTYKTKRLNFACPVHQSMTTSVERNDKSSQDDVDIKDKISSTEVQQPSVDISQNTLSKILILEDIKTSVLPTTELKDNVEETKGSSNSCTKNNTAICSEKEELCDKGIFDFDWPSDEDLLERRNRALLLMSKSNHVIVDSDVEVKEDVKAEGASPPKLFPIFMKGKCNGKEPATKRACLKKSPTFIKESSDGGEQMFIDAGQKEIGAKICPTCNMIYTIAQEEDENLHSKYHATYLINLKFLGWKEEQVVGTYDDGRIILIKETDKYFKLKKVQDVLFIANRDLGFPSASFPTKPNVMFLLFISTEKRVCGCIVAESIEKACPVVMGSEGETVNNDKKTIWKLGNWYASNDSVPAICGINRIWVSNDFRRHKVGSRMLDCLRQNFLYGHVVGLHEMAFTDPSPDGREFAASYTKTNSFLVYK